MTRNYQYEDTYVLPNYHTFASEKTVSKMGSFKRTSWVAVSQFTHGPVVAQNPTCRHSARIYSLRTISQAYLYTKGPGY